MRTLSFKLPATLDNELDAAARRRRVTKSALVRQALGVFLRQKAAAEEASFADLARDLIGCVEGPADLSTNPRHLRGYGR